MAELTAYPVDVEPFLRGGTAAQAAVAAEVDRACRDTGFLVVTGHDKDRSFIFCRDTFWVDSAESK